jgi:hypothetical protein
MRVLLDSCIKKLTRKTQGPKNDMIKIYFALRRVFVGRAANQ